MQKWFVGLLGALLVCMFATQVSAGWREEPRWSDEGLVGINVNALIRVMGPPTNTYTAPNGEQTFSWDSSGGTTTTGRVKREWGGSVSVQSQSQESFCRKSFVVGTLQGVGIRINPLEKRDLVVFFNPQGDTPAGLAGVQADDIILAIDGENMKGVGPYDAPRQLIGKLLFCPEGSQISLTLKRKKAKEPITVTLTGVSLKDRVLSFSPQGSACYPY
jgi:S1-C subfamily serine protease